MKRIKQKFNLRLLSLMLFIFVWYGCGNVNHKEQINSLGTKIQLLRNATMIINYNGKKILTDPMLADKESFQGFLTRDQLKNPTVNLPTLPKDIMSQIHGVLVSHSHVPSEDIKAPVSDHFDLKAIEVLNKNIPLLVQPFDEKGMKRIGFKNVIKIETELVWEGILIKRFSGKHSNIDALLPLIGESSGYVLKAKNSPTILWTGDTILTEGLKKEILENKPDIIITHSGGAQLPIDNKGNKAVLLMNADSTVEIAKLAPKAKIIAIHLESLDHCPVTRKEIHEKAKAFQINNIIIPKDGEELSF